MSRTLTGFRNALMGLAVLVAAFAAVAAVGNDAALASTEAASVPGLPDGRGYEKVSPSDNDDGNVYPKWPVEISNAGEYTYLPYEAARNGDAVAYVGQPAAEGGVGREGAGAGNEYVARRNAQGKWEASIVLPPSEQVNVYPDYQAFSPDITQGLLTTNSEVPLVPGAIAELFDVPYARDFETGAYTSLLPVKPPNRTATQFKGYGVRLGGNTHQPVFAGATADFSHILYMANDALTLNAVDGGQTENNLYDFTGGELQLVNVLPDGSSEPGAVFGGPAEPGAGSNGPDFENVISTDGSRVFWTGEGANSNIYMREDGTKTVQIDAGVGGGGQYLTATPSGSKVLFTKEGSLYEYDVETEQTTDLVEGAEVQGLIGTSEDLSYIYFVANAQLAGAPKQGDCPGSAFEVKECNLYALHVGEPARYIATLSSKDNATSPKSFGWETGDWRAYLGAKEAAVSSSGNTALFSSILSLTGYENKEAQEFYVYEYGSGKLRCVSCKRSGEPAEGVESTEGRHFPYSAFLPSSFAPTYALHWMSSDGSRVFFNSVEALVPQDQNHTWDVYEWERDGSGTCTETEGCVYLISGGTSGEGNYLVDASESGNDVFFTTRAKLVAEDENESIDLYDAHVGAAPPPVAPQCSGSGCQGLPAATPTFATPASVTFDGVGNLPPTKPKAASKKAHKHSRHTRKRGQHRGKRGHGKRGHGKRRARSVGARRSAHNNGRGK
ncbi:MAG TPA: hypothetical protein VGF95_01165 [Solirubrobacteraceae bacterium]